MKTHTRVLVIGGGVVGCSVLYHLTKLGWSDVMLVERSELTSGSTWHSISSTRAGGMSKMVGIAANIVSAIGAAIGGRIDDIIGSRSVIIASLIGLIVAGSGVFIFAGAGVITYWIGGLFLTFFVGPAQASSRSFMTRLTPVGREGEVFGFVGPNGAGKSTTIKVMLDIINDYQGQVRIYGVDARNAEARRPLAYVPEAPALYEQFTPLEILRMGLSMYGIRRKDADAWCMQWLERFSIAASAKRRIRELSKGTVQRVALAHAMAVEPRLLVLDEPLSGLDPVGRKDVVDILTEFKQQGGAIFFTSHVLHDVERIADRFGFINKGELLTVRSPRELAAERLELAADALAQAHSALGDIGGRLSADGLLGHIFSSFCIGK